VEQAFLPVYYKGQTEMSDPPDVIIHYGWSLSLLLLRKGGTGIPACLL